MVIIVPMVIMVVMLVMMVMLVMLVMLVVVVSTGQDRTKLTFQPDFQGNLWLAAFAILAMFYMYTESARKSWSSIFSFNILKVPFS